MSAWFTLCQVLLRTIVIYCFNLILANLLHIYHNILLLNFIHVSFNSVKMSIFILSSISNIWRTKIQDKTWRERLNKVPKSLSDFYQFWSVLSYVTDKFNFSKNQRPFTWGKHPTCDLPTMAYLAYARS